MTIQFYDLTGAEDDRRFSPFCWRVRLALWHKQLPFESIPWRLSDKEAIAFSGQGLVPVLVDGDRPVYDSKTIAQYLEEQYPNQPSLFGGTTGEALGKFVVNWTEKVLHSTLVRVVILDVYHHLHEKDQAYFRQSREQFFGMSLEAIAANPEENVAQFQRYLSPLRETLINQPFLAGNDPNWADYVVFSAFQWAAMVSEVVLIPEGDPVFSWRQRMADRTVGSMEGMEKYLTYR